MARSTIVLSLFLLLPVLFLGSQLLYSQEGEAGAAISGNVLNRLIAISQSLSRLNENLQKELQDSRQNSRELLTMLEASRQELSIYRQELEALRTDSMELLNKAESSLTELAALQAALRKAESSLMSLELSFEAYHRAAEQKINPLTMEAKYWKWGCIAAGLLAAGFGGVLLFGN